ncbi:hypothetical protein AGOR_G00016880 [Albula goreensis]|uniref:Cortactin-binding protein-2 N-terminal domain-containing protein n=1 Tax=Albula goreensis TaxID=1534307 RepID=A0A8T3EAM3_9TELE|nr:hypothetical protein AGOR_G00016880 [Albula goreensis]
MATDGAGGEQPPPIQTLATAGRIRVKCEFNMDTLSKTELLTLFSIMEGELEARDLVIEALKARKKDAFLQERYGLYRLADPFLALQRDLQPGGAELEQPVCASPLSVLETVMAHCRKMQDRMAAQLTTADAQQKKLQLENAELQALGQEQGKLSAQLHEEREKHKLTVAMLVNECKQLAERVLEAGQRLQEVSAQLSEKGRASTQLGEELRVEREKGQQMEAQMEKQLAELDTEREQLRARLGREEARCAELRMEILMLQTEKDAPATPTTDTAPPSSTAATPTTDTAPPCRSSISIAVGTDLVTCRVMQCQTEPTATLPTKPTPTSHTGASLAKASMRSLVPSENGPPVPDAAPGLSPVPCSAQAPSISSRVQAARCKFQPPSTEKDHNGMALSPPSRDLSPSSRDSLASKQLARHTVTQALSRFTSPTAGGAPRPGRPLSSEAPPLPGRPGLRVDRGNPPPIPPKKPGLSQTPSPPPPIRAHKPATPQLPQTCPAWLLCSSSDSHSGWGPPLVPSLTGGGPAPWADGGTPLLPAAAQRNVTLLPVLLTQEPPEEAHAALFTAADQLQSLIHPDH